MAKSLIPLLGATAVQAIMNAANLPEAGLATAVVGLAQALWERRGDDFVKETVAAHGGSTEELGERLLSSERFVDMFATALLAARRTDNDEKRVAMARVLGQAMQDDADLDEDAALLTALAALEAPHFRILKTMTVTPPPPPPLAEAVISEPYRSQLIAQGTLELGASGTWEPHLRVSGVTAFGHRLLEWVQRDGPIEGDGES